MGYQKFDDRTPSDPDITLMSDRAFRLWFNANCFAGTYLTDGHVPVESMKLLPRYSPQIVEELEALGKFIPCPGGWMIANYLRYQRSRAQVEEEKARAAERQSRRRDAKSHGVSHGVSHGELPVSVSVSGVTSLASKQEGAFLKFWDAYPRKVAKRTAEAAFAKALDRADAATILAGAQRYASDPNREARYTKHPATWLNGDCWDDDPLPPPNRKSGHWLDQMVGDITQGGANG